MRLPDFEQCLTARLFKKKADLGYTSVHSSLDRQSCKVFTFQSTPFKKRKIWKYPIIYHWKGQRTPPQPKAYFTMLRRIKYNRWPQVCFLTGAIQYRPSDLVIDPLSHCHCHCHWSTIWSVFSQVYIHRCNTDRVALSLIHYLECIFNWCCPCEVLLNFTKHLTSFKYKHSWMLKPANLCQNVYFFQQQQNSVAKPFSL